MQYHSKELIGYWFLAGLMFMFILMVVSGMIVT